MTANNEKEMTFWDHLDELRKIIFHVLIAVGVFMVVAFVAKNVVFDIILYPSHPDFILYRAFCRLGDSLDLPGFCPEHFQVSLINTQLPSQFLAHIKTSVYVGVLFATPYIIYQIFGFISPALYENERIYSRKVIFYSCVLFLFGVLLNYFIVFPLSFRFLATYQVNPEVVNTINISSYIDTFILLSLLLGIMSEIPILAWLFAKLGFITDKYMVKYRKHAIIVIMLIAAIITPTVDVFTLLLVFFPIYLLYELSILVVRKTVRKRNAEIKTLESGWTEPYNLDEK